MEHSPTYTIFKATEYKNSDIMVQNLKNRTVKAILSPMLSLGNSDYGYYPVYVDNKNYETVYLIYRKDIPDFLKNSFEKGDSFMLNNMEKYSKEKYKDRFSFFSNIEDFEKKIKLKDLKEKEKIVRILIFGKREEDEEISEGVFLRKGTDSKDNKFYVYDDENEDKILTVFAGQNENLDFFKFVNEILGEDYRNIEAKYGGRD